MNVLPILNAPAESILGNLTIADIHGEKKIHILVVDGERNLGRYPKSADKKTAVVHINGQAALHVPASMNLTGESTMIIDPRSILYDHIYTSIKRQAPDLHNLILWRDS